MTDVAEDDWMTAVTPLPSSSPLTGAFVNDESAAGNGGSGYARQLTIRDERGNVIRESYFDSEGGQITLEKGYATILREYNEANKLIFMEYLDVRGNPVIATNTAYAAIGYEYDENAFKTAERYYNEKLKLFIPKKDGCAVKTWENREDGKVLSERYWNAKGKLVKNGQGYAGIDYWYSEDGTVIVQTYVGENGKTITGKTSMGYSKLRRTYSETGKILLEEYLDSSDQPTRNSSRVYGIVYEYDDRDRLIREYTYGDKGQPYNGKRNYAITEYDYDATGKRTSTRYSSSGRKIG